MWTHGCPGGFQTFLEFLLCTQVVGNLLYYRFLNPAVVAPDAFDIVAMAAGSTLAAPQRHALGAVAQLLQHAAAGQIFSRESRHLRVLNDYLEDLHLKFRSRVLSPFSSLDLSPLPLETQGLWEVVAGSRKPPRDREEHQQAHLGGTLRADRSRAGDKMSIRTDLTWVVASHMAQVTLACPLSGTGSSSAEPAGYQSQRSASPSMNTQTWWL